MKLTYCSIIIMLCAVTVCACQKKDFDDKGPAPVTDGELIVFSADCGGSGLTAGLKTKAVSEVKTLDSLYVSATTGTRGEEESAWDETALFKKKSEQSSVYVADKYWPVNDPGYHFYASNVAMTSAVSGKVEADPDTDIVCAYLETPKHRQQNTLLFKHIYARIGEVDIKTQEGYEISDVSISVTCSDAGVYDICAGDGKTDGTGWEPDEPRSITVKNDKNDIYVVPGDWSMEVSYKLTKGKWTESFKKTAKLTLEKGRISKIEGTATGGDASEIELTVSVEEWKSKDVTVIWN